jgi:glycosyltransferase involved in cell wall biosynthesis
VRRLSSPVAYVVSRFPKLSETFVLYEMVALEQLGVDVDLYPLLRERADLVQPEALPFVRRATWLPFLSARILRSNLRALRRAPGAYLGALWTLVRATLGSPGMLVGGLAIVPKAVHMAELMRRRGVGHVHCHFANHPAVAGLVIHRLTGIPFSFTAHGFDVQVDRHMLREKVAEAAFVVAISEYNRQLILETTRGRWADKVRVIHCGVDTTAIRPPEPGRPPNRTFTVAAVGRLIEVKGFAVLVEACRRLRDLGVDVTCLIVGEGPERVDLERRIRDLRLEGRVRLLGARRRDEVLEVVAGADAVVVPSIWTSDGRREGIPVSLMEAMSLGRPIVASRLSGIPELVDDGESGLLVDARDVGALADAIRRLRDDPGLCQRLGAAGRRRVEADFDLHRNARELAGLFPGGAGR